MTCVTIACDGCGGDYGPLCYRCEAVDHRVQQILELVARGMLPGDPSWTYFLQAVDGGPIKIGRTLRERIDTRLANLQVGNPHLLICTRTLPVNIEAALHTRFRAQRIRGEWFTASTDLAVLAHAVPDMAPVDRVPLTFPGPEGAPRMTLTAGLPDTARMHDVPGEALHRTRTDDPFLTMEGEQPSTTQTIAEHTGRNTPPGTATQPPATQARSPHVPQADDWDPQPLRLAVAMVRLCAAGDRLIIREGATP